MRSSAPYTCAMLRGSCYSRGYNSTSAPLSCVVTTNTKRLHLCRPLSLQPADNLSIDIPSIDILFADILSAS